MSKAPDSVRHSLERMMTAARRLEDAPSRITCEEVELLGECNSRLRLIHGSRSASAAERTIETEMPPRPLRLAAR